MYVRCIYDNIACIYRLSLLFSSIGASLSNKGIVYLVVSTCESVYVIIVLIIITLSYSGMYNPPTSYTGSR
jgi:hypothetical protein